MKIFSVKCNLDLYLWIVQTHTFAYHDFLAMRDVLISLRESYIIQMIPKTVLSNWFLMFEITNILYLIIGGEVYIEKKNISVLRLMKLCPNSHLTSLSLFDACAQYIHCRCKTFIRLFVTVKRQMCLQEFRVVHFFKNLVSCWFPCINNGI